MTVRGYFARPDLETKVSRPTCRSSWRRQSSRAAARAGVLPPAGVRRLPAPPVVAHYV